MSSTTITQLDPLHTHTNPPITRSRHYTQFTNFDIKIQGEIEVPNMTVKKKMRETTNKWWG